MKFSHLFPISLAGVGVFLVAGFAWHSSAQGVTSLTSCQGINSSGSYSLANDVSSGGDCFYIRGNVTNVTFNGNGHTITTTGKAFDIADLGGGTPSNITLTNFVSPNGEVRVYGNATHHVTIQNIQVDTIGVNGSDDITIDNNVVGAGGIQVNNSDNPWPPLRPIITDNTITGPVGHDTKVLLEIAGGPVHPCPRIDGVVTGNTVNNYRNDPPPEATAAIRIRCATHSTVRNNTFRSFGTTLGLYLRDESDDGLYENNTFWTNDHPALWIASGNADKTFPARNTFHNNIIRSDTAKATFFQGIGSNNLFKYNIFWSATGNDIINGGDGNTFDHNTFYSKNSGDLIHLDLDTDPADVYTNNIFSYSGSSIFTYENFSASRHSSNYNLFQNRAGSLSFGAQGGSLAAWRTATGNDAQSLESNPLLTDPSTGDFTIASNSPARGAGSGGTDIGAKPYGSSPPPPPACTESWTCGSWSSCVNSSQSRTCTDANNCGTTTNRPALTQSCDSTAPTVSVTAPANSATLSGTVSVTANASDAVGVSGVQFKLDGANLGSEDTSAPYSYSWNTTGATNAQHTITAVARDAAGNSTTSATITVTVNNVVSGCTESWTCDASWSACVNNTQTRACTDANNCGTVVNRPPLSQSCTASDTTPPSGVSDLRPQ